MCRKQVLEFSVRGSAVKGGRSLEEMARSKEHL